MTETTHAHDDADEGPIEFALDAQVTIIDANGVRIQRESITQAIRTIRRRLRKDQPQLVGLAHSVTAPDDDVFAAEWWLIGAEGTHSITNPPSQEPDYELAFHGWTLAAPGSDPQSVRREAISQILIKAAAQTGRPTRLTGDLLGLNTEPVQPNTERPQSSVSEQPPSQSPDARPGDSITPDRGPTPVESTVADQPAAQQAPSAGSPEPRAVDEVERDAEALHRAPASDSQPGSEVTPAAEPAADTPLDLTDRQAVDAAPAHRAELVAATEHVQDPDLLLFPAPSPGISDSELAVTNDMAQAPMLLESADEPDTLADDLLGLVPTEESPETVDETDDGPTRSQAFAAQVKSAAAVQARRTRSAVENHPRRVKATAVAAGGLLVVGLIGGGTFLAASTGDQPDQPAGVTSAPAAESSAEQIDSDYTMSLWSLPPSKTQKLSVFAAGVVSVNDGRLILRDSLSADIITKVALDTPVQWTAEARFGDTDAVTVRTENRVHLITETGETADWKLSDGQTVSVLGTRPLLRGDDTTEVLTPADGAQQVEGNPSLYTAAADEQFLLQIEAGEPRVVAVPHADDTRSEDVTLTVPSDRAEFVKHLSVGHGLALALWRVSDQNYYGVHSLETGESTAFLPTSTSAEDAPRWQFGRGLDLAVIERYAIKLSDGTLAATAPEGETLTTALGPAAISEDYSGARHVLIDGTAYQQDDRIIGFSGNGTVWVREPDGSVTALSEQGGKS